MKLATTKKKPPDNPPSSPPDAHLLDGQPTFFAHIVKVAGITRKDLQAELHYSKTYVDLIMSGVKHDPVLRTRDFCAMLFRRKRTDLVIAVLVHVAGNDDFDGRVLTAVQVEAIKELAKAVK
jgi:hypothetical protein